MPCYACCQALPCHATEEGVAVARQQHAIVGRSEPEQAAFKQASGRKQQQAQQAAAWCSEQCWAWQALLEPRREGAAGEAGAAAAAALAGGMHAMQ